MANNGGFEKSNKANVLVGVAKDSINAGLQFQMENNDSATHPDIVNAEAEKRRLSNQRIDIREETIIGGVGGTMIGGAAGGGIGVAIGGVLGLAIPIVGPPIGMLAGGAIGAAIGGGGAGGIGLLVSRALAKHDKKK